jgi:hypothetical protein
MAIQYVLLVLMALLGVMAEGATQLKDLHKIFGVNVILLDPASSNISDTGEASLIELCDKSGWSLFL